MRLDSCLVPWILRFPYILVPPSLLHLMYLHLTLDPANSSSSLCVRAFLIFFEDIHPTLPGHLDLSPRPVLIRVPPVFSRLVLRPPSPRFGRTPSTVEISVRIRGLFYRVEQELTGWKCHLTNLRLLTQIRRSEKIYLVYEILGLLRFSIEVYKF